MMKRYIALLSIVIAHVAAVCAQHSDTLQREVTIVREFTPTIRNAEKINTMPPVSTPAFERQAVNYSYNAISAEIESAAPEVSHPYGKVMQPIEKTQLGYFNFDMGMYLAMAANAGVRIVDTLKDQLAVGVQFTSLDGDVPVGSMMHQGVTTERHQTFYDVRTGLNYAHIFDNNIRMSLTGAYRFIDFNYYGVSDNPLGEYPHQQVHNFKVALTVDNQEARKYDYEQWRATAGYEQYGNSNGAYMPMAGCEHHAFLNGSYDYALNKDWRVGGSVEADYLQYNGIIANHVNVNSLLADNIPFEPYTQHIFMARLAPRAEWHNHRAHFRIGAKADISVGDKTVFRFAPDIRFDWEFIDNYIFFLHLDGGKQLHTWSDRSKYCLYFDPSKRIPSSYSPIDALGGLRMRIIPEVSVTLYGGYEVADEALFQEVGMSPYAITWRSLDATCIKAGVMIDAHITEYVTLQADAAYREWQHQEMSISYDRPRWEVNATITAHPIKTVDVEVEYNMQLDRDFGPEYGKLNDLHNLQAAVKYRPLEWLSVTLHGNNLLNRRHDYYYGLPATGIQIMGGVGVKF